ncbi:di-heme oxidoredictase family protein [Labrenzia sp. CE80]|uniref:di-heme oxidoredictase family protein n=1 Tax=Labrenzia sp. CE80 TaxID=1788986 RepID=UPI00129AEF20|nr:di-heme oxidoredictase family protein [Labrenzia sp. CE80]
MISYSRFAVMIPALAGSLLIAQFFVMSARADEAVSDATPPWTERVLGDPIDYDMFAGETERSLELLVEHGERLFEGKFTAADGAGRPDATQAIVPTKRRRPSAYVFQRMAGLDANSCASCHNVPVSGGAGDFTANVFVSEGFESADFDTIDPQFSNERGTNALQGAGLIEMLAREMTRDLRTQRRKALAKARHSGETITVTLTTKGVSFGKLSAKYDGTLDVSGLDGIDADLTLRPFGQKGVFASLRQFTVNALNHHHGIQASERFGARWTGTDDFDGDDIPNEVGAGEVSALVAWQASLPAPTRKNDLPDVWQSAAAAGETLFADLGCAACHIPALPLESLTFQDPSPYDNAGTLRPTDVDLPIELDFSQFDWVQALPKDAEGRTLVPLFGDLKRHRIADAARDTLGNELLSQRFVARDVFLTAELWGVGSTAPYGHRGDLTSLHEIIEAHGGEATDARKAYSALDEAERQNIIAFLRSLEIAQ